MAIALVQAAVADGGDNTDPGSTSFAIPVEQATSSGNLLVLMYVSEDEPITSVADSNGNTWTRAHFDQNGANINCSIWYSLNASAVNATDTITVSWSAGINRPRCWRVSEFSGIDATPLDKTADSGSGSGAFANTNTTGTTAATTQADELVVAAFGHSENGPLSATPAGYTNLGTSLSGATGSNGTPSLFPFYKIVSATGTQTASATNPDTPYYANVIATFKAGGGGGGAPSPDLLSITGVGT